MLQRKTTPDTLAFGWVVSFTRTWVRGARPVKISVMVERKPFPRSPDADWIAAGLVDRACALLFCRPRDLKLRSHPADGPITRRWVQGSWLMGSLNDGS